MATNGRTNQPDGAQSASRKGSKKPLEADALARLARMLGRLAAAEAIRTSTAVSGTKTADPAQ